MNIRCPSSLPDTASRAARPATWIAPWSLTALLSAGLVACAASSPTGALPEREKGAVLMRSYYIVLRPDASLGKAAPPVDRFVDSGYLPGGLDGKTQLHALAARFTLKDLAFQFSDSAPIDLGGDATLRMGFGEVIRIQVLDLKRAGGGACTAQFVFQFGSREVYRRLRPFKPGDTLLFAGHIDASLPILSVLSLEIGLFPPGLEKKWEEFLAQADLDRKAFAPPPPVQRDSEPYLPGVGDVTMPEAVSSLRAVYPEAAKAEKMEGQVIVEVIVDREGKATHPRVLVSSNPIFEPAAMEAATTYRYRPAAKGGKPVAVTMNLVMVFKYSLKESP